MHPFSVLKVMILVHGLERERERGERVDEEGAELRDKQGEAQGQGGRHLGTPSDARRPLKGREGGREEGGRE